MAIGVGSSSSSSYSSYENERLSTANNRLHYENEDMRIKLEQMRMILDGKTTMGDASKFKILRHEEVGRFLIVGIEYPDCKNYEGRKVLVYRNVSMEELKAQGSIDPHFCDNKDFRSPIARFVPTNEGWTMAVTFCNNY